MKKNATRGIALALILLMLLALIPLGAQAEGPYTVRFDKNAADATGQMAEQVSNEESFSLTPNAFQREGYLFLRWSVNPDGSKTYFSDGYAMQLSDASLAALFGESRTLTLYAQWALPAVLRFEANGGSGEMASQTLPAGKALTLPENAFTRQNYTFAGWLGSDGKHYADEDELTLTDSLTLTAQWTQNTVSVNFAANGGTGDMPAVSHPAGNDYTVPGCTFTAPEGKTFSGWLGVDEQSYQPGAPITGLAGNFTLTAQWADVPSTTYTLSFDANDASVSGSAAATGSTAAMTNTTGSFTLPGSGFTKQGYTFQGWSVNSQAESYGSLMAPGSSYTLPAGETSDTLYAQWAMNEYASSIVTFDPAGGSLSSASSRAVAPGQPIGALPSVSREGYTFTGWWYNGQSIDATFVPAGSITVTARWVKDDSQNQPTSYTVHFNANGGSGTMADVTAPAGTLIYAPANGFTAPAGMRFIGWNTLANGSGGSYPVGSTIGFNAEFSEHEKTLYAQWSAETVIVTVYVTGSDYGAVLYNGSPASGNLTVPKGSTTAFTYGPKAGCRVKSVSLNGVDVTGASTLVFDRNSTLAVTFQKGFDGSNFTAPVSDPKSTVTHPSGMVETVYDIKPILNPAVDAVDRQNVYPTSPVSFLIPYPKAGMNSVNYTYALYHLPDGTLVPTTPTEAGLAGSAVNFSDFSMEALPNSNVLIGDVEISGSPIIGNKLTAVVSNTNNTGVLSYTWKRNGVNVGSTREYTTSSLDDGATLICEVTSSVQSGSIKSAPVFPAYVPTPVVGSYIYFGDKTKTGEIYNVSPEMQYATDVKGPWYNLTGSTLTGLTTPGTYYFRLRNNPAAMGSVVLKAFSWVTAETMYGKGAVTPETETVENGSNLVFQFSPRKNYQVAEVRVNGARVPNMRNATYLNLKNITGRADVQVGFYYAGNTPHTGDDSHLVQWCELAALSLVGLGAVLVLLKRKSKA